MILLYTKWIYRTDMVIIMLQKFSVLKMNREQIWF